MKHIKYHLPVVRLVLLALFLCLSSSLANAQNIFFTDFENFTPTNHHGWFIDNGIWQIGTPPATSGPGAPHDGKQCAGTDMTSGSYPTYKPSRLITPAISLLKYPSPLPPGQQITLTFWQWFDWAGSNNGNPSYGAVQVSTAGATGPWTTVSNPSDPYAPYSTVFGLYSAVWSLASIDLSAYAGQKIWIGFQHVGGEYPGPGWYIDDVSVDQVAVQSLPFNETFATFGTTNASWNGWSADNGVWQVGVPTNANGPGSVPGDAQCASSGLTADYPTYVGSRLVTPAISLLKYPSPLPPGQQILLTFAQWFDWAGSNNGNPSYGAVQVSTWTNGAWGAWTTVSNPSDPYAPYSTVFGLYSAVWDLASIDLSTFAGDTIRIGFVHVGGEYTGPGWYIDNVGVNLQDIPYLPLNQPNVFGNFTATDWYGWSADNGVWQVGVPTNANGPGSVPGDTQCASSGLTADYPTYMGSRLVTPAISLLKYPSPLPPGQQILLTFAQWFDWAGSNNGNPSGGYVQVSTWTNGAWGAWNTLNNGETNNFYTGSSGGWTQVGLDYLPIDLSAYAGDTIKIGFLQVGGEYTDPGWYIDDVEVETPPTAPTITSFAPSSGYIGTRVILTGTNFTGATAVAFNGTPATFTVNSDSQITTSVPAGATTGTITVTTPNGTVTSSTNFVVYALPPIASLALSPTTVTGGVEYSYGFVTLTAPAPPGVTTTVSVTSSNSAASPPVSVPVAVGEETAWFQITTSQVNSSVKATITATLGTSKKAVLTVLPLLTLTIIPNTVTGGESAYGLITLTGGPATSAITATLSSSNSKVAIPDPSVTIPVGSSSAIFNIDTFSVKKATTVKITATVNGINYTANLKVNP